MTMRDSGGPLRHFPGGAFRAIFFRATTKHFEAAMSGMMVIKRSGEKEVVMFDKITARINKLCYALDKSVSAAVVAQKVITGVYDGVTTVALDDLAAETAAYLTTQHPDYARLAARISVSNLHKMTDKSFSSTMNKLHDYINPRNGQKAPLISDEEYQVRDQVHDILHAHHDNLYDMTCCCCLLASRITT